MKNNNENHDTDRFQSNRRDFFRKAAGLGAGITLGSFGLGVSKNKPGLNTKSQPKHLNSDRRMLGDLEVSSIGLGCMSMTSGSYNPPRDKSDIIPVIRGAFDRGVTFFDTAEFYDPSESDQEMGNLEKCVTGSNFSGVAAGREAVHCSHPRDNQIPSP